MADANPTTGKRSGNFKHGMRRTSTWTIWYDMIRRCTNPKNPAYPNYGGRGISVCARWLNFADFLADMGERPKGLSLDRRDNNRGYEPENCYWATRSEQSRNRKISRRYIVGGLTFPTQAEVAAHLGVSPSLVSQMVAAGKIAAEKVYK